MAKKHFEGGPFGKATCGKSNVDTERDTNLVTCKSCKRTEAFKRAAKWAKDLKGMKK